MKIHYTTDIGHFADLYIDEQADEQGQWTDED